MMRRNSLFDFLLKRFYRPSVSDSSHQEKILAVRAELAALGIATGRSKGRRNDLSAGTSGVSPREAIDRLREADFAAGEAKNRMIREEGLVFAPSGLSSQSALESGASVVGGEELVTGLIEGTLPPFNRCLATTSMLAVVTKVARILGPKGLMPSTKTGTLVDAKDIGRAVKSCLQSVPFRIEKHAGLLNLAVGSLKGSNEKLMQNLEAVLEHLEKLGGNGKGDGGVAKSESKSKYISRVYLSTRYQPGILIKI